MLPDDVLLEIFDFHVNKYSDEDLEDLDFDVFKPEVEQWQRLTHVCPRWRNVVFESPRRLNLRLVCTPRTPATTLDLWPSLPLFIRDSVDRTEDVDEIIAVLERKDRVVEIIIVFVDCSNLENILAAMQAPFPELTSLTLAPDDEDEDGMVSVVPDSFLGGSAPRLEYLSLERIPFPGLPKLLLSANHLVDLHLVNIPHSGYISPEAMVTALSALTSLARLFLVFESPQSRPHWASRPPPPMTRSVLPALTRFWFKGVGEYLEDIAARIDAPHLNRLEIIFFNQIVFDAPQFIQFINRSPTMKAFEKARVQFEYGSSRVKLLSQTPGYGTLDVIIRCIEWDWQVSSMEQVCTSCLPLSTSEDLYIYEAPYSQQLWKSNIEIENALWLELLQPFTAVKDLYLSKEIASRIMPALQELVEGRMTEVLPVLQNIFLEKLQPSETIQAGIQQFVATRQATGHPITVSCWDNSKEDMASY